MNRFGWIVLGMMLAITAVFASMVGQPGEAQSRGAATMIVPVEGVRPAQLIDTWGQSREAGARVHQAIDIPAPRGTPVVAAFGGVVVKLFTSDRGGRTVYVRNGDLQAYYAHLDSTVPNLAEGQRVAARQRIGTVGDSGNAGAGNTHLHFAIQRMRPSDGWWQGEPVNPYPLLAAPRAPR